MSRVRNPRVEGGRLAGNSANTRTMEGCGGTAENVARSQSSSIFAWSSQKWDIIFTASFLFRGTRPKSGQPGGGGASTSHPAGRDAASTTALDPDAIAHRTRNAARAAPPAAAASAEGEVADDAASSVGRDGGSGGRVSTTIPPGDGMAVFDVSGGGPQKRAPSGGQHSRWLHSRALGGTNTTPILVAWCARRRHNVNGATQVR